MLPPFEHRDDVNLLLTSRYPTPDEFAQAYRMLAQQQRTGVIRSFIAEGVPYAFEVLPTLYEDLREFLAGRLSITPRDVTLVGSARLGYSLAPPPDYGKVFGANSDLDFAVASGSLFRGLAEAFAQWKADVEAGREKSRGIREEGYWKENIKRLPQNIARGFIDAYKIPNRYEVPMKLANTMWLVAERLSRTGSAPQVKRASLRVYRDWEAFSRQQLLNLGGVISRLPQAEPAVEGRTVRP